jgi:hypothetical protein
MALETELKTYKNTLSDLLAERGRFAVISGSTVIGTFACYEDAIQAGYQKCETKKSFLVRQILSLWDEMAGVQ